MEENKRRRRISTPLLLFLILMGITLALCLTVLGTPSEREAYRTGRLPP